MPPDKTEAPPTEAEDAPSESADQADTSSIVEVSVESTPGCRSHRRVAKVLAP